MGCSGSKWDQMSLAQKQEISSTKTLSERQRLARGETLPLKTKKSANNKKSAKEQDARGYSSLMSTTSGVSPTIELPVRGLMRAQPTTNGMGHQDGTIATNDYAPTSASQSRDPEPASVVKIWKEHEGVTGDKSGQPELEEVGGAGRSAIG